MKIALIDCDHEFTESFVPLIRECMDTVGLQNCVFDVYDDPDRFLQRTYTTGEYFMILMDLYQPGSNGIEVAGKIREYDEEIPIVFISSINEYATETYLVNAAYLILKPVNEDKCFRILNRVLHRMCPQSWELRLADGYFCHMRDISYLHHADDQYFLYLDQGGEHRVDHMKEDAMDKMMKVYRCFFHVTPDSVVNMAHITNFRDDGIELSGQYGIDMTTEQLNALRNHISRLQIEVEMEELSRV